MEIFKLSYNDLNLTGSMESIVLSNDILYFGDNKGSIHKHEYNIEEEEFYTKEIITGSVSKKRVDCIKLLEECKLLLVMSGGKVNLLDIDNLKNVQELPESSATSIATDGKNYIAIASKKKLLLFAYVEDKARFVKMENKNIKNLKFSEQIITMTWNAELLGIALKKAYIILNPSTGSQKEINNPGTNLYPNILVFDDTWLVVVNDSIDVHIKNGKPMKGSSLKIPVSSKTEPLLDIVINRNYLIIFQEPTIEIFDLMNSCLIQSIKFASKGRYKCAGVYNKIILFATGPDPPPKKDCMMKLLVLNEIPPDIRINNLLMECKISEAFNIFKQEYQSISAPKFKEKTEQFNIDAAWSLFSHLKFAKSVAYFQRANFDPRELLTFFPEALDKRYADPNAQTLENLIISKGGSIEKMESDGINIIITLLENKRKFLFDKYQNGEELIKFTWPQCPINKIFKDRSGSMDSVLNIIDTGLLKLYIMYENLDSMTSFLEAGYDLKCNFNEMGEYLKHYYNTVSKEENKKLYIEICQAFLCEKSGKIQESLIIWKKLTQQSKKEIRSLVFNKMKDLLINKVTEKKIITDFSRVLFVIDSDEGLKIFTENDKISKIMTKDEVLEFLGGLREK